MDTSILLRQFWTASRDVHLLALAGRESLALSGRAMRLMEALIEQGVTVTHIWQVAQVARDSAEESADLVMGA